MLAGTVVFFAMFAVALLSDDTMQADRLLAEFDHKNYLSIPHRWEYTCFLRYIQAREQSYFVPTDNALTSANPHPIPIHNRYRSEYLSFHQCKWIYRDCIRISNYKAVQAFCMNQ